MPSRGTSTPKSPRATMTAIGGGQNFVKVFESVRSFDFSD
jgi:hypothetical protein